MTNLIVKPFVSMEVALRDILRRDLLIDGVQLQPSQVGRDFPGEVTGLYVRIEKIPGGRTGPLEGDFVFDVETFHPNYGKADSAANAIEALLLRYPRDVKVGGRKVVFDYVEQNSAPSEVPWDDDNVHRLLATYVITARR